MDGSDRMLQLPEGCGCVSVQIPCFCSLKSADCSPAYNDRLLLLKKGALGSSNDELRDKSPLGVA